MQNRWIYLSHRISDKLSAYGDGERVNLTFSKKMSCGDACNNSHVNMSLHYGTHIDFPFHFYEKGKKACEYSPDFFVSKNVAVIDERYFSISNSLIEFDFPMIEESFSSDSDVILVNEDILLIEDIDYSQLAENEKVRELIISPLIFEGADAAPATLLARV